MRTLLKKLIVTLSIICACSQSFAQLATKTPHEMKADLSKIDKSIEVTRKKMTEVQDVMFLPDLYFFLAELYTEKARYQFLIAQSEKKGADEVDLTEPQKTKKKAIDLYLRFLENFPKHEYTDKALFFIAHEYREMGDFDKMLKYYSRLVNEYPKSAYWEETELLIGNYLFDEKKNFSEALEIYKKILARPANPFTPLARYKSGWCYINMNKFYEAMLAYEGVLTFDPKQISTTLPEIYRKTDVRVDALMALVWPYSEQKTLSADRRDPVAYFERLSPSRPVFIKVLDKVAKRLGLKEKHDLALAVSFRLLELTSKTEDRIEVIDNLYTQIKQSQKHDWPIQILPGEIASTLRFVRSSPKVKPAEKAKIEKNWEVYMRDFSTQLQKIARTTKKPEHWTAAANAYEQYLSVYPKTKYSNGMLLNQAESYFAAKKFAAAGLRYESLARKTKKKDLFESTVSSYGQALKNPEQLSRLEVVQSREGYREFGSYFLQKFPKSPATPMIIFNLGQTYYDERNFPKAIAYYQKFVNTYPQHQEATTAGRLILDCFNQREDYAGMINAGKALIANKRLNNPGFKADVAEIIRQADYKKLQDHAGDPRSREYANKLLAFAAKYHGSDLGDQALYEAFVSLKNKKDPAAFGPGEQLLTKHGDSKYAKVVVADLGQMALSMADYARAAKYFESFARTYPKDAESPGLLKSAAKMRELMGQFPEAAADYFEVGLRQDSANQYVMAQDWTQVAQILSANSDESIKTQFWLGLALYRQGKLEASRGILLRASKLPAKTFEQKSMVAQASFILASMELQAYKGLTLESGNETVVTKKKVETLNRLTKLFQDVISYGQGKWTIASLYELGRAHNEFAEFIKKASVPAGLSPEQTTQFRQIIQQQSSQFATKANDFFTSCLTNAEKFEVFTNFVRGCQSKGTLDVEESADESLAVKALDVYPPETVEIRKKLLSDSKNRALYLRLGQIYLQNKDYRMARLIFSNMTEMFNPDYEAQAEIGVTMLYLNQWDQAADNFKEVLKKAPKQPLALYGLAGLYAQFGLQGRLAQMKAQLRSVAPPQSGAHPSMNLPH